MHMPIEAQQDKPEQMKPRRPSSDQIKKPPSREEVFAALRQREVARAFAQDSAAEKVIYLDPKKQKLHEELQVLLMKRKESRFTGAEGLDANAEQENRILEIREQLRDPEAQQKPKVILSGPVAEAAVTQKSADSMDAYLEGTDQEGLAEAIGIPGQNREVDLKGAIDEARKLNKFMARGLEGGQTRVDQIPAQPQQPPAKQSLWKKLFRK